MQQRIAELLQAGWTKVKVITDHGWLMVPGGLPKVELPEASNRVPLGPLRHPKRRCPTRLSDDLMVLGFCRSRRLGSRRYRVSLPGMEYAHGGLTLQEALIPSLTVSAKQKGGAKSVALKEMKWSGMRLNVVLEGAQGLTIDVRRKVADADSSFADQPDDWRGRWPEDQPFVEDDDALGTAAFLVVVDQTGQLIFKHPVVIGEN